MIELSAEAVWGGAGTGAEHHRLVQTTPPMHGDQAVLCNASVRVRSIVHCAPADGAGGVPTTPAVCPACVARLDEILGAGHASDADCAPHIVDGECTVCGVAHGAACECGGRGYHRPGCKEIES